MGITITIQTYNRAEELRKTLLSLAELDSNGGIKYEILVVDNNSSDHTREVVEQSATRFPGILRYVHEGRQGLSHARNRAIAEARHSIVAFLDDDVNVHPDWLRNLAATYARGGDFAAVGGKAYLVYPRTRPKWLGERSEGLLTKMDYGPQARPAQADELYGVNLSFQKAWLQRVGGFRTDLGRVGACLLSGEETELLERIVTAGGQLLYEPTVAVGHRVPESRLRRRWFLSRCYWGHRGEARITPAGEVSGYQLLRRTWHLGLASWELLRGAFSHGVRSEDAFHHTQVLASRLGYWVGLAARLFGLQRPGTVSQGNSDGSAGGQIRCPPEGGTAPLSSMIPDLA